MEDPTDMSDSAASGQLDPDSMKADRYDDLEDATLREVVFDAVIEQLTAMPTGFQLFRIQDRADLGDHRERTIRRTLAGLVELGWLTRDGHRYYAGPRARTHLDLPTHPRPPTHTDSDSDTETETETETDADGDDETGTDDDSTAA